ncbi:MULTISPECIES: ABC transporter permease [Bacillaceae]|uniref:Diguanylate cyclase n=1 Tax=Cytobacillus oceanisediminis 2691 TaxID=1196031 RepID=A0A160MCF3_9BACI|nr:MULTISPECIES: ABC transporter permease [Bacillaceae]AND40610.1 diguanylate cyclase [Cytobacillus oceanisediminis 2691]MCM3243132.1 ABC transporter permease [Cytobacillus oceanisediminis]MCM3401083.1 ABC transporter permease [Cytobacillus oceanisediminis]MDK7665375.1 ABC transporter permease [Cytobacillus oceanisediminis]
MNSTAPKLTNSETNLTPPQNNRKEEVKSKSYWSLVGKRIITNKSAVIGASILLFFVSVSLLAPLIAPHPVDVMKFEQRFLPPGGENLLGTDEFGRDIFSRMLYGGRVSLMMGLVAVLIAGTIGVILGIISGYYRRIDIYIMQVMDILLAFPSLLLAIAIIAVLGVGLTNAMIAVAISVIPSYVRVVRGTVLSIREKEYIEAVKALGVSDFKIIVKHVFPNILSPVIVLSSLQFGTSILVAAALSFLGLGAQPPTPEWGAMAYVGKGFLGQAWWMSLFPGLAIMLVVLGFNLLGDGLRDALDPRQK